jgi:hypothetical protein
LPIDSIFWTIEYFGAPGTQLLRQRVNPYHPKVDVWFTAGRSTPNFGLIGAAEEHLNAVAPDDCKYRRSFGTKGNLFSIPITSYLKTQHIPVIFAVRTRSGTVNCGTARSKLITSFAI